MIYFQKLQLNPNFLNLFFEKYSNIEKKLVRIQNDIRNHKNIVKKIDDPDRFIYVKKIDFQMPIISNIQIYT